MQRKGTIPLALAVAALTLGVLWYLHRPILTKEPTWEEVQAEARRGGYRLINTADLAELCRREGDRLLLVDTRQEWEYRTGHIKGSVHFSMEPTAWARWQAKGPMAELLGPDRDRPMVFY